jgi:hypothetical protein
MQRFFADFAVMVAPYSWTRAMVRMSLSASPWIPTLILSRPRSSISSRTFLRNGITSSFVFMAYHLM